MNPKQTLSVLKKNFQKFISTIIITTKLSTKNKICKHSKIQTIRNEGLQNSTLQKHCSISIDFEIHQ